MTLQNIYIARHGYRWNWMPKPHPPNPTGVDSDPPLAPHGVEQAKQLADYLNGVNDSEKPQFIISSPFYRCVETGKPISALLNAPIVIERGVGEYYKRGRKIIPEPANYSTLNKFFPNLLIEESEWPRDSMIGIVPSLDGESPEEIFERCVLFWQKFVPIFEKKYPTISNVLIITHAATAIALGMSLLQKSSVYDYVDEVDKSILRAGAASLTKFEREGTHWNLTMNGNTEFLPKGEEMNWNFHSGFEAGSDEDIKNRKEEATPGTKSKWDTPEPDATVGPTNSKDEEFEDFYVTVDIPNIGKNFEDATEAGAKVHYIRPASQFQMTNLIHENPLIKLTNNSSANNAQNDVNSINVIDGKIYQTSWKSLVGTDLIFDEYGELIGKVNEHLVINENIKLEGEDAEEEDDEIEEVRKDSRTPFLKKAIKLVNSQQKASQKTH